MDRERLTRSSEDGKNPIQRNKSMPSGNSAAGTAKHGETERRPSSHDSPTSLNTCRLILDSVGSAFLGDIIQDVADLLGTFCAVYEKNGDYALSAFSSGWCRFMHQASRRLCHTPDDREAMASGKWLCHEFDCKKASLGSIDRAESVDIACCGGIRLFAVPICSGGETLGSIAVGYGDPPVDPEKLSELAAV